MRRMEGWKDGRMDVWDTVPNQPTNCICRRLVSLQEKIRAFVKGGRWYLMRDGMVAC
jgi:hypothetical protein